MRIGNVRLVDPASGLDAMGALSIDARGRIAGVHPGEELLKGKNVLDGGGCVLAPGLVDARVHLPGRLSVGKVHALEQAAWRGGVTTVICHPDMNPAVDSPAMLDAAGKVFQAAQGLRVHFLGALTRKLEGQGLAELGLLADGGVVGYSDGSRPVASTDVFYRALRYGKIFGLPVVQRPDDSALSAGGDMNTGAIASRLGLRGISWLAELIGLERDARIAMALGVHLHAGPLSLAVSLAVLRSHDEARLSAETCPHYCLLDERAVGDYRTFAKVLPPLRALEDALAVRKGVVEGLIPVLTSGHTPQSPESKRQPFPHASFGVAGLETLLATALRLHHEDKMALASLLGTMTIAPAKIFGLASCGRLAPGLPADLVLFDPEALWTIDSDDLHPSASNTAFDGHTVKGRVLKTFQGGKLVYSRS